MPEINIAPRTVSNYATVLKPAFKKDLDGYLKNRQPVAFLSEVRGHLQLANGPETGNRYNIQLKCITIKPTCVRKVRVLKPDLHHVPTRVHRGRSRSPAAGRLSACCQIVAGEQLGGYRPVAGCRWSQTHARGHGVPIPSCVRPIRCANARQQQR